MMMMIVTRENVSVFCYYFVIERERESGEEDSSVGLGDRRSII